MACTQSATWLETSSDQKMLVWSISVLYGARRTSLAGRRDSTQHVCDVLQIHHITICTCALYRLTALAYTNPLSLPANMVTQCMGRPLTVSTTTQHVPNTTLHVLCACVQVDTSPPSLPANSMVFTSPDCSQHSSSPTADVTDHIW